MALLNENGYQRPTYAELLEAQIARAKTMFGEDIDTSETSVLGKIIRIMVYDISVLHEELENVYYSRFPSTASGISLDRLCTFVGTERKRATYAYHEVRLTGTTDATINAGELVLATENNTLFTLAEPVTLYRNYALMAEDGTDVGMNIGIFVANVAGTSGNVGVGMINRIYTPNQNVTAIEHTDLVTLAIDMETDIALRNRFLNIVTGIGSGTADSIRSALWNVDGVTSVTIIENDTYEVDTDKRPPKSFECYVLGGDDNDIANAIFSKAPVGIKTVSTFEMTTIDGEDVINTEMVLATEDNYEQSYGISVPVEVIDNAGYSHTIWFTRTIEHNVYMYIHIKADNTYNSAISTDGIHTLGELEIKENIINYLYGLSNGEDVINSKLVDIVHNTTGVKSVQIELSDNDDIFNDNNSDTAFIPSDIAITNKEVARATADSIIVEVDNYADN